MIKTGLVSISFRKLSCTEIIKITKECGLQGIEWGADRHVLPGDIKCAESVRDEMQSTGLLTSAYGSYYKAGTYGDDYKNVFLPILQTAEILQAPVVRIWAGITASAATDAVTRKRLVTECQEIAKTAAEKGIRLAFECHRNTLTDDYRSALLLMDEIGEENVKMYWQPNEERDFAYNKEALQALLPHVENVHVFHWPEVGHRESLSEGKDDWKEYFSVLKQSPKDHWCSLEFMPDNEPDSLPIESAVLQNLLQNV